MTDGKGGKRLWLSGRDPTVRSSRVLTSVPSTEMRPYVAVAPCYGDPRAAHKPPFMFLQLGPVRSRQTALNPQGPAMIMARDGGGVS